MKLLVLFFTFSLLSISCNSKPKSTSVNLPSVKRSTTNADEIIDSLYEKVSGFECELEIDSEDTISKVFYIDRSDSSKNEKITHKFYNIINDSDKVDTFMKIKDYSLWFITYNDELDGLFSQSTTVSKKDDKDDSIYKLTLEFDSKVNEFSFKIASQEFIETQFIETEIFETGRISNCIEATYKMFKGLD